MQALAHSRTTFEARGGLASSSTFMRKKVIEVRRSTVDFKSCSFAGDEEGKYFCNKTYFHVNIFAINLVIYSLSMNRTTLLANR